MKFVGFVFLSVMCVCVGAGAVSAQETMTPGNFYGPKVGGVSVGLIGFAIGFIGQFVLIAGIVLHIVAAARRRRLNQMPKPEGY